MVAVLSAFDLSTTDLDEIFDFPAAAYYTRHCHKVKPSTQFFPRQFRARSFAMQARSRIKPDKMNLLLFASASTNCNGVNASKEQVIAEIPHSSSGKWNMAKYENLALLSGLKQRIFPLMESWESLNTKPKTLIIGNKRFPLRETISASGKLFPLAEILNAV